MNRIHFYGRRPACHFGYTLVEIIIVMSIGSVVMLTAVSWIHRSMLLSKQIQSQQDHQSNLIRLAQFFRNDARNAVTATIHSGELVMTLVADQPADSPSDTSASQQQVQYHIDGSRIDRTETTASGQLHREQFTLAPGSHVEWLDDDLPGSVTLLVLRSRGTPQTSRVVESHLDRDDLRLRVALDRYAFARRQP